MDFNAQETIDLAKDVIERQEELFNMKRQLVESLVKNEMHRFFSVNWPALRSEIARKRL